MESILVKNGLYSSQSVAASIGGRNDMGRLLSPSGRKIITDNISFHNIPLIKNNRLAENIKTRMKYYSQLLPISRYKAVINVGGG